MPYRNLFGVVVPSPEREKVKRETKKPKRERTQQTPPKADPTNILGAGADGADGTEPTESTEPRAPTNVAANTALTAPTAPTALEPPREDPYVSL